MTNLTAPSFSQIKAKVAAIQQKIPKARVIGIHSPGRWTDKSVWTDGEIDYSITQCDSPLSFRMALREPASENTTKVLITNLHDQDLGEDILLRLAKRQLLQIDPWQIVRSLFDAHAIDPRLTHHTWIAESLLDSIPKGGFSPARGGFLDAETVWPLLLSHSIGLRDESPDLTSLLKWSLNNDATARFRSCGPEFQKGAVNWLTEKAGPAAAAFLHCVQRLERADAVPIGLCASVIYHPSAIGKLEKATGKLEERYFGGTTPRADDMQRWSGTATEVIRTLRDTDPKFCEKIIGRGDEILCEIGASKFAHLSDTSRIGFDERLAQVGTDISKLLEAPTLDNISELLESHRAVRRHDHAFREERRLQRVEMAVRLIRWLGSLQGQPQIEPKSFDEAADGHLLVGGFVDWARLSLRSGDPVQQLSAAYARLFDRVTETRERQARIFAKLLADWTATGSKSTEVIPVERILDQVVAPLADNGLVLVIVVDGMSVAVLRELLTDVTRHEWIAISEPGRQFNRPGLATIPSVTEFSRASLLSGALRQGSKEIEQKQFEKHSGLLKYCRSGSPPILFHKAGLSETEDTVLAAEVRKEIASTHRRVVGVVVNAVDDHLLKGEQIDTRWSRDEIKVLPALLHEARIARRLVVLLSDHGHVLDCHAKGRVYQDELAGGERWRTDVGTPESDEFVIEGSRVVPKGHRIIAPWSEGVRFGVKKNGYHGGLNPQEMIVPIAVLASTDDYPSDWSEQPIDTPAWWDDVSPIGPGKAEPAPKLKSVNPQDKGRLFDMSEDDPVTVTDSQSPAWILRLIACSVFKDQKRFGGRGIPSDDIFTRLLSALDERGGKMTSAALSRALEFPAVRLPGLLAKAERVLNVDGYDVLRRDDAADTIELNRDLLLKQFDLVE
ncbi:MAG: BREX-2 system phosphatase PglZ [Planctomycetaceae bacterium]